MDPTQKYTAYMLVHLTPSHKQLLTCEYIPHPIHTSHCTLMGLSPPEAILGQAVTLANC